MHVQTSLSGGCLGRLTQGREKELGALSCQWWRRRDTRLSSISSRQRGSTSIEHGSFSDLGQRSQDILHAVASVVLMCIIVCSIESETRHLLRGSPQCCFSQCKMMSLFRLRNHRSAVRRECMRCRPILWIASATAICSALYGRHSLC